MCLNYAEIGQRIRSLRKQRGFTQEKLAEAADLSVPYLSHVERGTKKASLSAVIRISAALGVGIDRLLYDRPSGEPLTVPSDKVSCPELSEVQQLLDSASGQERQFLCETVQAIRKSLRDNHLIP